MFDIKKTKECLLKIVSNPQNFKQEDFKNYKKYWYKEGISIFLEHKDEYEFYEALNEICKDEFIKNNFTKECVTKKLEIIISKTIILPEENKSNFLTQQLNNLKSDLKKDIEDWIFIVPLENISIKNTFSLGDVKLYVLNTYRENKLKEFIKDFFKDNIHYNSHQKENLSKLFWKRMIEPNSGLTCAEVKVKGSLEKAQQIAFYKIRLILDILKLYSYNMKNKHKGYFGIKGEIMSNSSRSIIRYTANKNRIAPIIEHIGQPFELDKDTIEYMKKKGLNELNKILIEPNAFESRVLTAIYWFGESLDLQNHRYETFEEKTTKLENLGYIKRSERFLYLFNALECIFIFDENEPITNNIAERTALLLGDNYEDRKYIKKEIKDKYNKRSKIVHHGEIYISKYDLDYLTYIVWSSIMNLLKKKNKLKLKTPEKLNEYFEKLKLS